MFPIVTEIRKTRLLIRGDQILRITGRGPDGWITEPYHPQGLRQVDGQWVMEPGAFKNAPNISEIEIVVDE